MNFHLSTGHYISTIICYIWPIYSSHLYSSVLDFNILCFVCLKDYLTSPAVFGLMKKKWKWGGKELFTGFRRKAVG